MGELDRRPRQKPDSTPKKTRLDVVQRMTLAALAAFLVAISLWCLLLLFRSLDLRRDLAAQQASIDDLLDLRAALERPVTDAMTAEQWPMIEPWIPSVERLMDQPQGDVPTAARRLRSELEQLHRALLYAAANTEPAATERVLDASFTALKAVSALEDKVLNQVTETYAQLGDHWRSLNALVIVCLLLCASNLGLLHLAHRRRAQLQAAHDRAVELSSHDSLTGLWNREAILRMMRREISRANRLNLPVSLILADVDRFREINGLVGQEQGDVLLQEVAWRLGSLVRPYDTMGRLGGDSFLIILPTCDPVATGNIVDRLRRAVHEQQLEYSHGRLDLSLSFVHLTVENAEESDLDLAIHRLQEGLATLKEKGEHGAVLEVSSAPRSALG